MNIIGKLREDSSALSRAAFDIRGRGADAIEELAAILLRWQAAWDWADEKVIVNASPSLIFAAEETDRVLRAYGIQEASNSVGLKQYATQIDAAGRNTVQLTRTGLMAAPRRGAES